jgi:hypothetical protein
MKFFIYISLTILILAPFCSITCRRNSNKSKKSKNISKKNPVLIPVGAQASATSISSTNIASSSPLSPSPLRNSPLSNSPSSPTINVQRSYANSQPFSYARPVPVEVSRPPFFSGHPQGPPQGPRIVRGVVSSPVMLGRYAIIRNQMNECPLDFHGNTLVRQINEFCPSVCNKKYCIQINELCCVYTDLRDLRSHVYATRIMKKK